MDEHIEKSLIAWRRESMYTAPDDWIWASPHRKGKQPLWLSTIMRYYIQPAAIRVGIEKNIGWHTFRHTFSTLIKSLVWTRRLCKNSCAMLHLRPQWMDTRRRSNSQNGGRKNNSPI
jgi:hypothetical protein